MNTGDTALVLISAAFVFLMTPALGFFYGGLGRRKNVVSNLMNWGSPRSSGSPSGFPCRSGRTTAA